MGVGRFRDVFRTSSALVLSQALNFLFIPLIARIFPPEIFSKWALYFSVVSIVGGISTARYSDSLVLIRSNRNAWTMFLLCLAVGFLFFLMTAASIPFIYLFFGSSLYGAGLMPFSVFLFSVHMSCLQVLTRYKLFSRYSFSIFTMSILPSVFQVFGGLWLGASGELIVITGFLGQLASCLVTLCYSRIQISPSMMSLKRLLAIGRRYSQFPKYSMGFAFFSLLRVRALYLIFGAFRDPSFLGAYAQTDRILGAPSALLGASIRPIFFRYAAEVGIFKVEPQLRLILKNIWFGAAPFVGALMFYSNEVIAMLLGEKWSEGAWIFRVMLIPSFLLFSTNWLDRAYDVLKLQRTVFVFEVVYGAVAIGLSSYAIFVLDNTYAAVTSLAVAVSVYYTHWVVLLFRKLRGEVHKIIRSIAWSVAIIFGTFFLLTLFEGTALGSLGGGLIIFVTHGVLVLRSLRRDWIVLSSISRK